LLDAIIKVGKTTGMQDADIERLEAAKKQTQFSRAIDDVNPDYSRVAWLIDETIA